VALKSFVAEEAVANQQPAAVADALNRAANRLASDVANWVKG
jgi:cholesterol transport system auxiliary component